MGIRINKVLTELNIGLQTLVDYLKTRRGELGDIKDDANMNTKLTDQQYEAVINRFSKKRICSCGHINNIKNSYCVNCGKLLNGAKAKIVISKNKYESLLQTLRGYERKVDNQNDTNKNKKTFTPLGKLDFNSIGRTATEKKTFTPLGKIDLNSIGKKSKDEHDNPNLNVIGKIDLDALTKSNNSKKMV